jgi:holo-[acyl-carrier protein] synthase
VRGAVRGPCLACGVDLVDIAAFGRALEATNGRMQTVCFTAQERRDANGRTDRLATRWALKEAVAKALGVGLMQGVGFRDVEMTTGDTGRPSLTLHDAAQRLARELGFADWAISVAHQNGFAVAFVVASSSEGSTSERSKESNDG